MKIRDIIAYPLSFPVSAKGGVALGIGRTVKRDTVVVKVITDDDMVGFGEAHHGRAPGAVAHLVNTTLKQLLIGRDALDVVGAWQIVYQMQLNSHGMGAAAAIGLSGIDMALWDLRAKAAGWPLYRMLGGAARAIPAYAGGISLGFQPPENLVEEARGLIAQNYSALKLRVGDNVRDDKVRLEAVRKALGPDIHILTDANAAYSFDDVRRIMPVLDECGVGWLEEPFAAHDYRNYADATRLGRTLLAAGENHYTRFEFHRLIEDGAIRIVQPDLSKTGGITEAMRVAALASAWKLRIHPHTSTTGINMAATIHFLCAIENRGYFESDVAKENLFRDQLCSSPYVLNEDGCVRPLEEPGIGVEVDEDFIRAHPVIEGPCYV
jgi:L-alanine-DL-glutamate epimerase-like enolase superfamily enzyme